ncbi:hypothetical protein T260_16645 [Geobacillus thermopakistaniensis]|nr:hypothetical protein GA8_16330 [Geobacillus sp. A8]ESU70871.1 hypothetical protein T260_16645 [Geobacillus sp. MAS1]
MQNSPSIAQRKSDSFLTNGFYEYLQKQKVGYADMIPLFFNIVFLLVLLAVGLSVVFLNKFASNRIRMISYTEPLRWVPFNNYQLNQINKAAQP